MGDLCERPGERLLYERLGERLFFGERLDVRC